MRIFIGYGYNERDKWIEKLVFPLIDAFGAEVVSGKEIYGSVISTEIQNQIHQSDALIAFLTRRDDTGNGWTTHRWVSDELAVGIAKSKPILEVREIDVIDQGGIAGDRHRVEYNENERDKCIVEIAKAIGRWLRRSTVDLQILPQKIIDDMRPFVMRPEFSCTYNLIDGNNEIYGKPADVKPITGGLFIKLKNISKQALVQIQAEYQGQSWTSDFEPVEQYKISLSKD